MKKYLFLDIDGVINSMDWFKRKPKLPPTSTRKEFMSEHFDPEAVAILRRILKETGCEVVLSSSWRGDEENHALIRELVCDFIDITPRSRSGIRGAEIHQWLESNLKGFNSTYKGDYRLAILDDDSDMLLWQKDIFFHTKNAVGLTNEVADAVIAHLNS